MKRKKIKTILCHMAIITICVGVFCHGYINGISISKYDRIHSYAEADNWTSCDTSDLVTAFRYYCKSRNLALEGSVADALTSFTTTTFNNICSTLGIDPTQLQAELKKTTMGNLGLRFLFSQTGITAYNRIFAEFLQNNDLNVGDTDVDKTVESGKFYTDISGNSSFVYYYRPGVGTAVSNYGISMTALEKYGTPYIYDQNLLIYTYEAGITSFNVPVNGNDINVQLKEWNYNKNYGYAFANYYPFVQWSDTSHTQKQKTVGNLAIGYDLTNNKLRMIGISTNASLYNKAENNKLCYKVYYTFSDDISTDQNVKVVSPEINNNTYNNNYVIIYNGGDTYISDDDDEPLPNIPPSGGGGGDNPGGDPDNPGGDPDNWNPTNPNIPTPTNPNFPTVNLPDIDIPDLPSLNFSLGDLRNKFPFSLPFDIIAVLNVLDGEPQAPHIEANVPIGRWYTWEIDFDFSEFDNYARIFRAFEFIGFCIGLAIFTVHFVKG